MCSFTDGYIDGTEYKKIDDSFDDEKACRETVFKNNGLAIGATFYPDGRCYADFGNQSTSVVPSTSGARACLTGIYLTNTNIIHITENISSDS